MTITNMAEKRYGILVKIPDNDPMSAPHLLGDDWSGTRWYGSEGARDEAYAEMLRQPGNYRKGDVPSVCLSKISSED